MNLTEAKFEYLFPSIVFVEGVVEDALLLNPEVDLVPNVLLPVSEQVDVTLKRALHFH